MKKEFWNQSFDYQTRALLYFNLDDDNNSLSQSINDGKITNPEFYLRLYEAEGNQDIIDSKYILTAQPLSQSWHEGVGKLGDNPVVKNGTSWENRSNYPGASAITWSNADGSPSHGGAVHTVSSSIQSFTAESPDINMNITNMVQAWLSGSQAGGFTNNGLLLRFSGSEERILESII